MFNEGGKNLGKERALDRKKARKRKDFFSSSGNLDKTPSEEDVFESEETELIGKQDKGSKATETLTKQEILILNQNKAEEIIDKIGLLEMKKNGGEAPDEPAEEAEKANDLAILIKDSKYIKDQELRLEELNSIYESYKNEAYDNESNKIISEIHELSWHDENNGRQYRDEVKKILKSKNVEQVNNDLKQLFKELKAKQSSKEPNEAKETVEPSEEEIIDLTDEVRGVETADVQSNRIKQELEELQNRKDKLLSDEKKSEGVKIREFRKIIKQINELNEKLKYFKNKESEIAEVKETVEDEKIIGKEGEKAEAEEEIIELTDEVRGVETADVQSNRIKQELEELQNRKDNTLSNKKKSEGAKIRECRKIDRRINELEDKLKYFEDKEIQETFKKDPELRKIAEEEKERILKMKPKEKKKWSEGMANLGYRTTELKSKFFGGVMEKLGKATKNNKFLNTFFNSYAGIYEKAGERAENARETVGKGKISRLSGTGQGMGNLFKYGRIIYDLAGSGSARGLNPFRHVTAAAMFVGRTAEAAKETRFEYEGTEEKIDKKMRVKDEKRAMNEAWAIYNKAFAEKNSDEVKTEDLEKAYKDNLPKDIQDRLNRMDFVGTKFCEKILNKDTKKYADRLIKKIEKIESDASLNPKEKEIKKQELLRRNEELINDLDRMVGDQGMVDNIAFWSRFTEKVSKGVATVLIVDSVTRLASAGWNMRHIIGGWLEDEAETKEGSPIVQHFQINKEAETQTESTPDSPPYDPSGKPDPFDTPLKQKLDAGANQAEAAKAAEVAVLAKQAAVENINIKIEGKINTFSEAIYEATKNANPKVKENFIHKVLGDGIKVDKQNIDELVSKSVRKLSVANIKMDDGLDVKNLVHKGDVVSLKSTGDWEVVSSSGIKAEAVSELQLRQNWADAEGVKHGFDPKDVSFAGDNEHLDMRSFKTEINNVEVTVDNEGGFSGNVGGEEFTGNISELDLDKGQTAKGAIEEYVNQAKTAQATNAAAVLEKEIIETATDKVRNIFNNNQMSEVDIKKICKAIGVNFSDGIDPKEWGKLAFLNQKFGGSERLVNIINSIDNMAFTEQRKVFNLVFDGSISPETLESHPKTVSLFTEIKPHEIIKGMNYDELIKKMAVSNFPDKEMLFYGKVLAGDKAVENASKLLGGADVEKVSFGKNGKVIAELVDGRKVSISNDGAKGSIEIEKPFWGTLFQRDTLMRKGFKVDLGEEGLKNARKELGVEVEGVAKKSATQASKDSLKELGIDKKNARDLKK